MDSTLEEWLTKLRWALLTAAHTPPEPNHQEGGLLPPSPPLDQLLVELLPIGDPTRCVLTLAMIRHLGRLGCGPLGGILWGNPSEAMRRALKRLHDKSNIEVANEAGKLLDRNIAPWLRESLEDLRRVQTTANVAAIPPRRVGGLWPRTVRVQSARAAGEGDHVQTEVRLPMAEGRELCLSLVQGLRYWHFHYRTEAPIRGSLRLCFEAESGPQEHNEPLIGQEGGFRLKHFSLPAEAEVVEEE